ncbi:uncharacterized protein LOC128552729 [Mercenaria mercenaria]|uniref:uncharacterized protein LOC128552729 n=1 Tax=Mercenaria mercenaria TaxID=6596 RepID=UPI00234F54DA|nr:uncharacterized protein LOC128552729 [Mercenaria mercenaria]
MRAVTYQCAKEPDEIPLESGKSSAAVLNAFNILMDGEKVNIKQKTTCHNRKDELYNDVVKLMTQKNLKMPKWSVSDEGEYVVQVITSALWCLTNHHLTINDAAKTSKDVIEVPKLFETFQGYNDFKRKKLKSQPLSQELCDSHGNASMNIVTRPVFHSDVHWQQFREDIDNLASCFAHYKMYLENRLKNQTLRQGQLNPPRTVGNDISVEFRAKTPYVYEKYKLFDEEIKNCDFLKPVLFDENVHLTTPFENRMQMKRFFDNLSLSVNVDLYRYCPGGGVSTIMFVAKVPENRSDNDAHIHPVRVIAQINDKLPEYHTRAMKREFRQKMNLIAKIQPGVLDFVYKELALDASVATNPEMQQRIKLISLGESGLVADLRELNTGRPSDKFDVFFEKLEEVVEDVTAADERRHGVSHLSHWISLGDLIGQAAEKCPEGTLVPSKSLVRLQFTPRNPYTHAALNFTSRLSVQYKIQRRQL